MNIKNISILLFIFALFITGCEKELLNKVDPNTVSNTDYWKTSDDFHSALITAYQALQYRSISGGSMTSNDRIRTDMTRSFSFYTNTWTLTTFTWPSTLPYIGDRWKQLYVGVFRTNQIIDNIATMEASESFTQDEMDEIEGQARFLRALYYFWIANSYNGAIIHRTVPVSSEEIQGTFKDYNEVLTQAVIPDFKIAKSLLPEEWDDNNKGRATWGAATGLLGKVYLYSEEFDSAAAEFSEVIESGIYRLTTDIGDNFSLAGEHNAESLFEVAYSDVLYPGVAAGSKEVLPNGDRVGQATTKAGYTAPQGLGGLRTCVPTFWATELFLRDSIDITNPINADGNRYSKRAYSSISFIGQDGDYYLQPTEDGADWFIGGAECAYWKKGTNWATKTEEDSWSNTMRSGINERILRYADVKLMYAEALLRRSGSDAADLQTALEHVDDIRTRAGVLTLQGYRDNHQDSIPVLHQRGPTPYTNVYTTLSRESLLTHIQMVERPLELTYEGNSIRWHDLRRWGIIGEVLNEIEEIDYTIPWLIYWWDGTNTVQPDPGDPYSGIYFSINIYQGHQAQNYNSELHDFFPVPIDEINSNKNINE